MRTTLIESAELAAHCSDPDWAVVDCRFDLARPEWGAAAYAAGHVPGAVYANLDHDLSASVTESTGRHPLPAMDSLADTFGRWGIDRDVQVVAYDQGNGAFAARLWWLLRWAGHHSVAVLNGGFAAWQQEGLPVTTRPSVRQTRRFALRWLSDVVATDELLKWLQAGQLSRDEPMLLDARSADRFAGQNETLDPVAGHIPGAHNRPFTQNLDALGRFLPPDTLRAKWLETLNGRPANQVVSMCGSGVTACHNLLAMEVAGLHGARLYAGSWSEWIRDKTHPVAR
jgi:thiosulfate/3-mercaptopyruvate sulfurtransferase